MLGFACPASSCATCSVLPAAHSSSRPTTCFPLKCARVCGSTASTARNSSCTSSGRRSIAAVVSGGEGGALSSGFDFDGLRAALSTPLGFLAGWTHYLAFDLFAGAWIVRESARLSVEPRPYLFFTLMTGPIGLAGFLLRRWWCLRSWSQLGEPDLV